jgi:hypothetical protein
MNEKLINIEVYQIRDCLLAVDRCFAVGVCEAQRILQSHQGRYTKVKVYERWSDGSLNVVHRNKAKDIAIRLAFSK